MMSLKKAVILSAGLGTRLMPLTADRPKVMVPVKGRPLLEHHLEWLRGYGITQFYVNLHAHPESIPAYFSDGRDMGVEIHYFYEPQLRGTAGALHGFASQFGEPFLVHYGDVYSQLAVDQMADVHFSSQAIATLAVHTSKHPEDSDIVEMDAEGRVIGLHHKPKSRRFGITGNAACYILQPEILSYLDESVLAEDFIVDVFPRALAAGHRLQTFTNRNLMMDMGTLDRYSEIERILSNQ